MYLIGEDDLFLNPTAEVPVTNIYRDEILEPGVLPRYLTAHCASYRREAGAYGKDTRGMVRVHQFDKVELVKIVPPETGYDEHEKLAREVEAVLQALELPYRVMLLCSGDMSFAAAKCYDFEVWAPGTNAWLECSSCSIFEDFQARRMGLRFRREAGAKVEFPHTLNASGVALPRTFAALLENHQTASGAVRIPKALRPYLDGLEEFAPEGVASPEPLGRAPGA
jgi:seryl-tRNA synthetase